MSRGKKHLCSGDEKLMRIVEDIHRPDFMFHFLINIKDNGADGTIVNDADGPGSEVAFMKMRKGSAIIRPEIMHGAAIIYQERTGVGIEGITCRIIGFDQVFFFKISDVHL